MVGWCLGVVVRWVGYAVQSCPTAALRASGSSPVSRPPWSCGLVARHLWVVPLWRIDSRETRGWCFGVEVSLVFFRCEPTAFCPAISAHTAAYPGGEHSRSVWRAQLVTEITVSPLRGSRHGRDSGSYVPGVLAVAVFVPAAVDAEFHNCVTVVFLFSEIKGVYWILMLSVLKLMATVNLSISMKTKAPRLLPLPQDLRSSPARFPQVKGTRLVVGSEATAFQSGRAHCRTLSGIRCQSCVISNPAGGSSSWMGDMAFIASGLLSEVMCCSLVQAGRLRAPSWCRRRCGGSERCLSAGIALSPLAVSSLACGLGAGCAVLGRVWSWGSWACG